LPPLALFWPLGAPFFGLASFLRGSLLRRNVRALFRNGGGFVGAGGFCVLGGHFRLISLCGSHRGHDIHHSGCAHKQANSEGNRTGRRAGDGVGFGRQMVPGGARW
jgi:hypothetical protein